MKYADWKYTFLLISMVLLFVMRIETDRTSIGIVVTDVCMALVVLAGLCAACTRRHHRIIAVVLGLPVFLLTAWSQFESPVSHQTFVLMRASLTVFMGFNVLTILQDLIDQRTITRDTLVGAFSGYVLIGAMWTEMYCWVDLVVPGAFSVSENLQTVTGSRWNQLVYFSFVTLTTVGYGDIVPTSLPSRLLACFEAICGQFYVAVLVSGLVSIRIGQLTSPKSIDAK